MTKITDKANGKAMPNTVAYVRMTILDKNKEIEARKIATDFRKSFLSSSVQSS